MFAFPLQAVTALSLIPVLSGLQVLKPSIYVTDADLQIERYFVVFG